MFYFIYYASFIVVLPGILFALICQLLVTIRFKKYSRVQSSSQWTANEMSDMLLEKQGIRSVEIRKVDGSLTDNYNPSTDVLSLSESVYSGTDIASLGVAAHECGHAVQKHTGSFLLTLRSVLVPVTNIGSRLSMPLIVLGLALSGLGQVFYYVALAGVACYGLCVVFQLVTLPTEFNASHRALRAIEESALLLPEEQTAAKRVLTAAALTYVAALSVTIMQFLRLLLIVAGGNRRRD